MISVQKLYDLTGKTALVCGGAGFLGSVIVDALIDCGARVVVADRRPCAMEGVESFVYDLASPDDVVHLAEKFPDVSIVVNAAAHDRSPNEPVRLQQWSFDLIAGLNTAYLVSTIIGARMNPGVMLNIGSDLSLIGPDQLLYKDGRLKPVSYSVVKHGIVGLTRWCATTYAPNVRTNCLCPGGVYRGHEPEFVNKLSALIPLKRMMQPHELKGAVAFLCSDASSFVNGAIIPVDGGRTAW